MDKNSIRIIPFSGNKEEWRMWWEKFMARSEIKGYYIVLTDDI